MGRRLSLDIHIVPWAYCPPLRWSARGSPPTAASVWGAALQSRDAAMATEQSGASGIGRSAPNAEYNSAPQQRVSQGLTLRNGVRVGRGSPEPRCSHGDRTAWHERDWPLRAHAEYNSAPQQRVSQRLTLHGGVRVGRGSPEPRCSHGDRTAWNERDWALRAQRGVQLRAPAEGQPEADRPLQIPGPPAVAGIPATSPGGGLFLAPGACAHDGSQRARDRCNG